MGIARRQFLQAGLTSLMGWQLLTRDRIAFAAEQYIRQAQGTKRKRSLLIGINQYEGKDESSLGGLALRGCINDVELQKELLIYRFGFAPQDIITLTDRDATRANITNAITEQIAETLPDDLVVIHFSGYGSRLGDYNTLVPVDGGFPQKSDKNPESLRDITEQEWQGWLQEIATDRILNVIDAGYYYPNTSVVGNFRLRSRMGLKQWQPAIANDSSPLPTETAAIKAATNVGTTLRAAADNMLCLDAQWAGFSSGAFTYALVQQLWQIMPATTINIVMSNVANTLDRRIMHNDDLPIDKQIGNMWLGEASKPKAIATKTFDFLPVADLSADGVITGVNSDHRTGDIYLAGLPITVLSNYGVGTIFNVTTNELVDEAAINPVSASALPNSKATVQLKSYSGFNGKVEILGDRNLSSRLEVGQLAQEVMRSIPHNVKLAIAIDTGLSKIERIDATSALSTLPNMFGVNANEQGADCLFGTQSASYGLFTIGHIPILGSFGSVGESVGVAIKRLQPFLESLLAAKLIRITENQASSQLNVRTTFKAMVGVDARSVTLASKVAARASLTSDSNLNNTIRTKPITIGDRLECQIENFGEYPLYTRIFCLDSRSKLLTPNFIAPPYASDGIIPPATTLTIPYPKTPINWSVSAPKGAVDVHVVISRSPLLEVANSLEKSQRQASSLNGLISIASPLQVAQALLIDLDRAGKPSSFGVAVNASDAWMLDVQQWATFNFNYEVA